MLKRTNPEGIAAPISPSYTHTIEVPAGARVLHISGQVGMAPDGTVPDSFEAQAEIAYDNLLACLKAAGMGPADVVKVTSFLTRPQDIAANREIRGRKLEGQAPASTLLIVAGLASPKFLFDVEATAAKVD